jgi:hypothetical protein
MSLTVVNRKISCFVIVVGFSIPFRVERGNASTLTGVAPGSPVDYILPDYSDGAGFRGSVKGRIVLHPLTLLKTKDAESSRALLDAFPGFKVIDKNPKPNGEFSVKRYEACKTGPGICSITTAELNTVNSGAILPAKQNNTIGSVFIVEFLPESAGLSSQNLNFVQIVNNTYQPDCSKSSASYKRDKVDSGCPPSTPLYWSQFNSSVFLDRPEDPFPYGGPQGEDEYFNAKLFAAKVTPNQNLASNTIVTLYDGVSWGWKSTIRRTPSSPPNKLSSALPPSPDSPRERLFYDCSRYYTISCCSAWGYASVDPLLRGTLSLDPEFQDNSIYENNATTDPTAVPTPALLPTLATAGIYHGRKWRKRKQAQKDNDIAA